CGLAFHTRSGLSQHCRHRHPNERNEQRKEKLGGRRKVKETGSRNKVWTEEEIEQLVILEAKYVGKRNINKCIEMELKSKTNKQISDKRRELAKKRLAVETEVVGDLVEEGSLGDILEVPPPRERIVPLKEHQELEQISKICKQGKCNREGRVIRRSLEEIEELLMKDSTKALGWAKLEEVCFCLVEKEGRSKDGQGGMVSGVGQIKEKGRKRQSNALRRYAAKKAKYRFYQVLFGKDRRRLARIILGEPDRIVCGIPLEDIEVYYREMLSEVGHGSMTGWPSSAEVADNDLLLSPISVDEVRNVFKEFKKDSAPGPDKVRVSDLWDIFNIDSLIFTKIFNMWFLQGQIPTVFKENRTILIPKTKDEEELKKITSWRPLTIGSMWVRAYTKILAKRLSEAVKICARQKGFVAASGCEENISILNNLIKGAKRNGDEIAIVFVDLAKTFDSIGHGHIVA
ncbi:MAG: reverse transcriptase domain-containing protein, partial [Gallicola sp.]|nr:reverse transcriptase domain-containing protein [Gallicola sp.]